MAAAIMLLCVACTASESGASPVPTTAVSGSASECPPIELRQPDGQRVDLTGEWVNNTSLKFHVYQSGRCVWWVGGFPDESIEPLFGPLGFMTMVFQGELRTDFTLSGTWAVVRVTPGEFVNRAWGSADLRIDFETEGGMRLVVTHVVGIDQGVLSDGYLRRR